MHTYLRARLLGLKILEVEGTVLLEPAEATFRQAPGLFPAVRPPRTALDNAVGTRLEQNAQRLEENVRSLRSMKTGLR